MIEELFEIEGIGGSYSNFTDDKKDIKIYLDKELIHQERIYEIKEKINIFSSIKNFFVKIFD